MDGGGPPPRRCRSYKARLPARSHALTPSRPLLRLRSVGRIYQKGLTAYPGTSLVVSHKRLAIHALRPFPSVQAGPGPCSLFYRRGGLKPYAAVIPLADRPKTTDPPGYRQMKKEKGTGRARLTNGNASCRRRTLRRLQTASILGAAQGHPCLQKKIAAHLEAVPAMGSEVHS